MPGGERIALRRAVTVAVLTLLFVLVVLPAVIVKTCRYPDTQSAAEGGAGTYPVRVLVHTTGEVVTVPLDEYVAGVVAAEMPTSFGFEALKAQAVVARTFAVRHMRVFGGQGVPGRPDADVTTDVWAGGQDWLSRAEARREWGFFGFYSRWAKVESAVRSTRGLILTHNGVPIEAAYHSTCGGATDNSEDVWSGRLDYLRGVTCSWCAHSPWMEHVTEVSVAGLEQAFGIEAGTLAAAAGTGRPYLEVLEWTPGGRAKLVRVGEVTVRGLDFRRALDLRSARFTFTVSDGTVRFVTRGYGHGVGLCQYGADGMARAGKDFLDILTYYYTGVEVETLGEGL
ncbi:MAG TPA: stage II sporulation protein D [Clostridiales bacterium]|nr:stage II sporulation protein D [Clostridiales bacterium]